MLPKRQYSIVGGLEKIGKYEAMKVWFKEIGEEDMLKTEEKFHCDVNLEKSVPDRRLSRAGKIVNVSGSFCDYLIVRKFRR